MKLRAVIISKNDLKDLELMLWMYDIHVIKYHERLVIRNVVLSPGIIAVTFECSDMEYIKIYEKMDSLGMWKGDFVNPRYENKSLYCDDVNYNVENLQHKYFIIGV